MTEENKQKEPKTMDQTVAETVEELAGLQFLPEEIATIAGMTVADMLKQYGLELKRGRLIADAAVRKAILALAKSGSPPAQKQYGDLQAAAKPAWERLE